MTAGSAKLHIEPCGAASLLDAASSGLPLRSSADGASSYLMRAASKEGNGAILAFLEIHSSSAMTRPRRYRRRRSLLIRTASGTMPASMKQEVIEMPFSHMLSNHMTVLLFLCSFAGQSCGPASLKLIKYHEWTCEVRHSCARIRDES